MVAVRGFAVPVEFTYLYLQPAVLMCRVESFKGEPTLWPV